MANIEQIVEIIEKLKSEKNFIISEQQKIDSEIDDLVKINSIKHKLIKQIEKDIKKHETQIETNILYEDKDIQNIDGFKLISEEEFRAIMQGMDKTDYRKYGKSRFIDLESIVKTIAKIKHSYPAWKLVHLKKMEQILSKTPPENYYNYTYITQEGFTFCLTGILAS